MRNPTLIVLAGVVLGMTGFAVVLRVEPEQTLQPAASGAEDARRVPQASARPAGRVDAWVPSPGLLTALARARSLPSIDERRDAIVAVLAQAAEAEPAAATEQAVALAPLEGREEALHETLGHFLTKDPNRAFAFLHDRAARVDAEAALVLARETAAFDPALALTLAERLPQPLRSSATSETFAHWATLDPAEASARAAQLEDEHDRAAAASAVASVWAHEDPQAAFAWARRFDDLETRGAALEQAISAWAEADPLAAARAAAGVARGDGRQRLLDAAAQMWADRDSEAALAWVASALDDGFEREAAATTVLLYVAQSQPARAAERAAQWAQTAPAGARSSVLDKVLTAFSARSAADAATWAHQRPRDAPLRDAVVSLTLQRWQLQDAAAAESWRQAHAAR